MKNKQLLINDIVSLTNDVTILETHLGVDSQDCYYNLRYPCFCFYKTFLDKYTTSSVSVLLNLCFEYRIDKKNFDRLFETINRIQLLVKDESKSFKTYIPSIDGKTVFNQIRERDYLENRNNTENAISSIQKNNPNDECEAELAY